MMLLKLYSTNNIEHFSWIMIVSLVTLILTHSLTHTLTLSHSHIKHSSACHVKGFKFFVDVTPTRDACLHLDEHAS